jgi:MarR family transcriptional regulator, organic hydroperoxide resistance regulator
LIFMNRDDVLKLDSQLCFLLYATTRVLTQAYAGYLEPLGLTYPQYLVLLVLWEEDGATVGHLGERLRLDSGTITPLVKRLEAAGIVHRERSATDERVVEVHLTPSGRRLRERAQGIPSAMFCKTGLSTTGFERLRGDLRRVLDALQPHEEPKKQEIQS